MSFAQSIVTTIIFCFSRVCTSEEKKTSTRSFMRIHPLTWPWNFFGPEAHWDFEANSDMRLLKAQRLWERNPANDCPPRTPSMPQQLKNQKPWALLRLFVSICQFCTCEVSPSASYHVLCTLCQSFTRVRLCSRWALVTVLLEGADGAKAKQYGQLIESSKLRATSPR